MGRLIALILALVLGVGIAWQSQRTPTPAPADAPATVFSALRALPDIEAMARAPHPIGSPENLRVRDHLIRRMTELGLAPQVRPGVGVQQRDGVIIGGRIENVVGVLPGRDRNAPALALMAHYDSTDGSPGAADDAAGTAAALEIVRAIKARGVPTRDVMVLLTDGEEAGLLGANHFFARDPLAKRIGLVLNMETRGGGGRVQMFQTSPNNGALVDLVRRTADRPAASSLTGFVYDQMPNDTDLTETLAAGVPGLNYAFAGRQFDYHSATSTPTNLDKGSLQDMGQQVLAVAEDVALAPTLPGEAPSVTYSQVFGDLVVAYPPWVGWILLAVAAGLLGLALQRARKAERFAWLDVVCGAGALVFATLSVAVVLMFARKATGADVGYVEQRYLLAQVTHWETAVILIGLGMLLLSAAELARGRRIVAVLPLLAGLGCSAFGGFDVMGLAVGAVAAVVGLLAFGKPVSRHAGWAGVMAVGLLASIAIQAAAPLAAHVFAWPLLIAAVGAVATDFGVRRGYGSLFLLAAIGAVSVGWLGEFGHGAFLSMDLMPLLALPALLVGLALWPLAQPVDGAPPERGFGAALLLAGLAVTAWVRFADPYDARHPEAASVLYHLDKDVGRAFLISTTPDRVAWAEAALAAGGPVATREHWYWWKPFRAAPTPLLEQPAASVTLAPRPDGALSLSTVAPAGARALIVRLKPSADVALVSADGVPLSGVLAAGKPTTLYWGGSSGVELVLKASAPGRLEAGAAVVLPAWPVAAKPLPPMPANVMGWNLHGATVVTQTARLAW